MNRKPFATIPIATPAVSKGSATSETALNERSNLRKSAMHRFSDGSVEIRWRIVYTQEHSNGRICTVDQATENAHIMIVTAIDCALLPSPSSYVQVILLTWFQRLYGLRNVPNYLALRQRSWIRPNGSELECATT
jgi:hypothetical protein